MACLEVLVAGDACNEGEYVLVRQGRSIAVVVVFLMGCSVLLLIVVGCSGTHSETSNKKEQGHSPEATASEEARCDGTRTFHLYYDYKARKMRTGSEEDMKNADKKAGTMKDEGVYTTNDLPGCPKGGPLLGTDKADKLYGGEGYDGLRGLGAKDDIYGGEDDDVLYGGPGNDVNNGGAGRDAYAYSANFWGQDTIKDTSIPDTTTYSGDYLFFDQAIIGNLTIYLISVSDTASHEVSLAGTQSTIDWAGDVIEDVSNYGYGDDFIRANDATNYLRSWNGGDTVDGKGGDDIIDVADGQVDDTVFCGGGTDDVYYDGGDNVAVSSCEHPHLVNPT